MHLENLIVLLGRVTSERSKNRVYIQSIKMFLEKLLVELAAQNEKIVGITPAMLTGSSLKFMLETFPE